MVSHERALASVVSAMAGRRPAEVENGGSRKRRCVEMQPPVDEAAEAVIEDGLRKVRPYRFEFRTFAKVNRMKAGRRTALVRKAHILTDR